MPKHLPSQTITASQAATLLKRSTRWVHLRVREGWIVNEGRGRYPLASVIRGMLAYYEDQLQKASKAGASSATDARTREIELRIAERESKLLPVGDAQAVVKDLTDMVLAELPRLAARATDDPDERMIIGAEVVRMADTLRRKRESALGLLGSGRVPSSD